MTNDSVTEILADLTSRDQEKLVLKDNGRKAILAGGPDYFASLVTGNSPGPNRKPIARDTAERMVGGWTVVGFEAAAKEFTPPDWVREYPTTTYRGPKLYPVPEDWLLDDVEGAAIGWKRYDEAENADELSSTHELDDDVRMGGPTDEAVLFSQWNEHDETVQKLSFNYAETAFEDVIVENNAELWAVTAEALAKFARGEEFQDVSFSSGKPPKPIREEQQRKQELERRKNENESLYAFEEGTDD